MNTRDDLAALIHNAICRDCEDDSAGGLEHLAAADAILAVYDVQAKEPPRHDVFRAFKDVNGGRMYPGDVYLIDGHTACVVCDEKWPCAVVLNRSRPD